MTRRFVGRPSTLMVYMPPPIAPNAIERPSADGTNGRAMAPWHLDGLSWSPGILHRQLRRVRHAAFTKEERDAALASRFRLRTHGRVGNNECERRSGEPDESY